MKEWITQENKIKGQRELNLISKLTVLNLGLFPDIL